MLSEIVKGVFGWIFEIIFELVLCSFWRVLLLTVICLLIGFAAGMKMDWDAAWIFGGVTGLVLGIIWQFQADD